MAKNNELLEALNILEQGSAGSLILHWNWLGKHCRRF